MPLSSPTPETALFQAVGIEKSYTALVLRDVHFRVHSGEVHALVGENGAGKSTLARIIAGLTRPDAGQMTLAGVPFSPRDKVEAEALGVRMVMQELNVISTLTVAENIFFDQLPHSLGWVKFQQLNALAKDIMGRVGLRDVDPQRLVGSLGVGQQQLVEIAAGLSRQCRLLILDEPTAALTGPETERLFDQIRSLRSAGVGLIYISHRLEEIQQIADRITVLRDGKVVATREAAEITSADMVRLMVGRDLGSARKRQNTAPGPEALRVEQLRAGKVVRDVSFELFRGEILGFAGLMGSGRTETMRAIFGADRLEAGAIYLHGKDAPARIRSPSDAVRQGIALLTEDRKEQGLLLPLSICPNVTLTRMERVSRYGSWIQPPRERAEAEAWAARMRVRCTSVDQRVVELSGGNQQKVVIAKWLFRDCDILIFDEPTRGIDVGAKFEIYQLLEELAQRGKAIIFVSSELKELLSVCDRLIVMSAGRVAGVFRPDQWSEEKVMQAAFSGYQTLPTS